MTELTKEELLTRLRERLPYLAKAYGVARIGLFGSFAQDTAKEDSDVDLVIEFERPIGFQFVELVEYLEQQLGRNVDILTPNGIKSIRVDRVIENIRNSITYV